MKVLRVAIPVAVTVIATAVAVLAAIWLTSLVPGGEWAEFLKALIIVAVIGATLLVIGWSAYFSYVIRDCIEKYLLAREEISKK